MLRAAARVPMESYEEVHFYRHRAHILIRDYLGSARTWSQQIWAQQFKFFGHLFRGMHPWTGAFNNNLCAKVVFWRDASEELILRSRGLGKHVR
eukprot:4916294-Karenia_brevis.AAC.1